MSQLEAALGHERTSIAREMHDETGQTISALKSDLSRQQKFLRIEPPELAAGVGVMIYSADQLLATVHRMCAQLRPALLGDLGFFAAYE